MYIHTGLEVFHILKDAPFILTQLHNRSYIFIGRHNIRTNLGSSVISTSVGSEKNWDFEFPLPHRLSW